MTRNLDLAPIGNCAVSALIDREGRFVWCCAPRVDSDPVFSSLLDDADFSDPSAVGFWAVDAGPGARVRQAYLRNSAVLRTEVTDAAGAVFEILDFAPRFRLYGRIYRPTAFFRLVRPVTGTPRVTIRLRPAAEWGAGAAPK